MIGFLKGQINYIGTEYCFIDVSGVGYRVFMTNNALSKISKNKFTTIYTHTYVREDAILLYGFLEVEEHELFLKLIAVSGIGPKAAMTILASKTVENFKIAIQTNDLASLTKISGIGKKTAERLVLELKDKLGVIFAGDLDKSISSLSNDFVAGKNIFQDTLQALQSLGYDSSEIIPVLKSIPDMNLSVEANIKFFLKEIGKKV